MSWMRRYRMAKIKYCTDEFLEDFKLNFEDYFPLYRDGDYEKLDAIFSNPDNIVDSNIGFQYEPLITKGENNNLEERENIKIIYHSLGHITPTLAREEKMWVAMYNTYYKNHLYKYIEKKKHYERFKTNLFSSIFYNTKSSHEEVVQNLSRLWWLGYVLIDSYREDPYELLDFYTESDITGKTTSFFSSNIINNRNIAYGIIETIMELRDQGILINNRRYYNETNKYFNLMGGTTLIDLFSKEEIKDMARNHILAMVEEEKKEKQIKAETKRRKKEKKAAEEARIKREEQAKEIARKEEEKKKVEMERQEQEKRKREKAAKLERERQEAERLKRQKEKEAEKQKIESQRLAEEETKRDEELDIQRQEAIKGKTSKTKINTEVNYDLKDRSSESKAAEEGEKGKTSIFQRLKFFK